MSAWKYCPGLAAIGLGLVFSANAAGPLTVNGVTEPYRQATISSEIAGRIVDIRKNEGFFAKKGDTILELDFEEARLDAERNRVISESDAELRAAKLKAETAKQDLDATKMVHDSTRSVSEEELWKKQLEYDVARTECDRIAMTKEKARLEYRISLENLKRHFLLAPFSGMVSQRFLNEGENCKPQEPLVKLVDVRKCRFITYVPAARSQGLVKGKKVTLTLGGVKSQRTRQGAIEFASPVVDASSGLRTIKVVFDNADGSIQPGVTGTLQIEE
jgi:RND family efflux transporter MFP subunit